MTTAFALQADDVLRKLLDRSREGKVTWRRLDSLLCDSPPGFAQYVASLPNWSVIVRELPSGEASAAVINTFGERIGDLTPDAGDVTAELLRNLLSEAQGRSSRFGGALEQLSSDLDEL